MECNQVHLLKHWAILMHFTCVSPFSATLQIHSYMLKATIVLFTPCVITSVTSYFAGSILHHSQSSTF